MNCSHVSICIGEIDGAMSCIESTTCENGVRTIAIKDNAADKIVFVARQKKI